MTTYSKGPNGDIVCEFGTRSTFRGLDRQPHFKARCRAFRSPFLDPRWTLWIETDDPGVHGAHAILQDLDEPALRELGTFILSLTNKEYDKR